MRVRWGRWEIHARRVLQYYYVYELDNHIDPRSPLTAKNEASHDIPLDPSYVGPPPWKGASCAHMTIH